MINDTFETITISLLNVDTKILSKAISKKLKAVLPTLISSQQTAYVKYRFIGESGRLVVSSNYGY